MVIWPNLINELTGKKHASFFYYVGYGQPFPEKWIEEVKSVGAIPHIAWEPNDGLDVVKDDEYLRTFARRLRETEVPVFLRFASEMNGAWTAYTGDPEKYVEKWRLVHDVMEEEAPNVIMVWTVFTFPQSNILDYYPGDDYVDWVGVNIYNVVYHNNDTRQKAAHEDPLELLDFVYNNFRNVVWGGN
ncbi:copper amine oxidase domain-containing protein [Calderihabitans maritimus]|uniref:Copper amine oxidase domain-containing protein n=2 Tax=Calderihabitans maritimus TaxID=1246530 RepID=A0A1Z5HQ67_9FIRM|nr:copper amine oxidase domain-containing protein [Calderihabitans maritimus]